MQNYVEKYLKDFRGSQSKEDTINELVALSYFAKKTKDYEVNFSSMDFSDHDVCVKSLNKVLENVNDSNVSDLTKEIIESGILRFSKEVNDIYKDMLANYEFDAKELIEQISEYVYEQGGKDFAFSYTTNDICSLIIKLFLNENVHSVLDICSGEGQFLYNCACSNPELNVAGIEMNTRSTLASKIKLSMVSSHSSFENVDVLSKPMEPIYDLVFTNCPWGLQYNAPIATDKNAVLDYGMFKNRVDWAFAYKAINSLNDTGKAIAIMPEGSLFNNVELKIRKEIVDNGYLDTVISMPAGCLIGTGIACSLVVFSKVKKDKVRFVNASQCIISKKRNTIFDSSAIYELCYSEGSSEVFEATYKDIEKHNYCLSCSRYFGNKIIEIKNPTPLEEHAEVFGGYQYTTKNVEELDHGKGNIDVLKITNINENDIDFNSLSSIEGNLDALNKYFLKDNDIVISSKGTIIKVALIKNLKNEHTLVNGNLSVIRVTSDKVNPTYLYCFLKSETGQKNLNYVQTGSIIINLTKNALLTLNIPLLDIETQEVIANRYENLHNKELMLRSELNKITEKLSTVYDEVAGD